ncbi:fibronectin type III domain-containing protein [Catenovulum agarivorans DS-2]|uniref:Fibronectin type III domain-containing protein n=1 Tax=Catenovulum agarivorans DS-2 TaxID=1328313 RepID=W7QV59_9ALTE|nr:hypothetical protein [Catenovulum agarivorans]EWH11598.1 fibronectin type III domain-containing protein [Catenovulum agarivorans DS-2]
MIKQLKSVVLLLVCLSATPLWAAYNTALLNLKPLDIDSIGFDGDIQFALRSNLDKRGEVQMMSRRDMESELFRQGLSMGNSDEDAVHIGKALGVEFVIFGSVQMSDNGIATEIRMIDIVHERLAKEWKISFSGRNDINDKGPALANTLIKAMAQSLVDAKAEAKIALAAQAAQAEMKKQYLSEFISQVVQGGVEISWRAIEPETIEIFNLYRGEAETGPYTQIASLQANSYLDSQVESGKSYFYKLAVVEKSTGEQAEDVSIQQITYIDKSIKLRPLTPTILSVDTGVKQSTVTFVPNLDNPIKGHVIRKYKIYRKRSSGGNWLHVGTLTLNTDEPKLSYSFTDKNNVEDGEQYSYSVSSVNSKGYESPLSGTEVVFSPGTPNLSVHQDNLLRQVELDWQVEGSKGGFYIYRRELGTTIWQRVGDVEQSDVRRFIDRQGLRDGAEYEYYVSLVNNGRESDPSNIVSAKTKGLPARPENLQAQSGLVKAVKLTWNAIQDPDLIGYKLYRMEDDGNGFQQGDQLSLAYEIPGYQTAEFIDGDGEKQLKDGVQYHYAIAAVNKYGARGDLSYVASASTKTLPKSVGQLSAEAGQQDITISWPASTAADIANYILSRKWNEQDWQQIAVLPADATGFVDKELKPYAQTQYKLISQDQAGLQSAEVYSSVVTNPATLQLSVKKDQMLRQILLTWNEQQNVTGYQIYRRKQGSQDWNKLVQIDSPLTTEYLDNKKLADATAYEYQISAIDGFVETPASEAVTAKTKSLPSPPKSFAVQSGLVKQVQLTWQSITDSDVAGYYIYRKNDEGKMERIKTIKDIAINTYIDDGSLFSKLNDGTEYEYAISAYNTYDAEGGRTRIIGATTKPVPSAPKGLQASANSGIVELVWNANAESDISNYVVEKATASCNSWRELAVVVSSQQKHTDSDVVAGSTYCYRVKAIDQDELESSWQQTEVAIAAASSAAVEQ